MIGDSNIKITAVSSDSKLVDSVIIDVKQFESGVFEEVKSENGNFINIT